MHKRGKEAVGGVDLVAMVPFSAASRPSFASLMYTSVIATVAPRGPIVEWQTYEDKGISISLLKPPEPSPSPLC